MKRYTAKENLTSMLIGVALAGALMLLLRPTYLREQEERKQVERELVQEWIQRDREIELAHIAEIEIEPIQIEVVESPAPQPTYGISDEELDLLACVVHAEAGNQDLIGKRLVVDVVLNRVDSPLFPDSIYEVITEAGQFSTWSNGMIEAARAEVTPEDYEAVWASLDCRLDTAIYFFCSSGFHDCGIDAYQHGDHYFSYLGREAMAKEEYYLATGKRLND